MLIDITKKLIANPSITPDDHGCMEVIREALEPHDYEITRWDFEDVSNLWATHGNDGPVLCFLGHTDVVPPGPEDQWDSNPFTPEIRDGYLFGRGAADMKGSVAAMVCALQRFVTDYPHHDGVVALLLTSDEEGLAVNGTVKVIEQLSAEGKKINWCVVGEPSSQSKVGDVVKIGRRGSLSAIMKVIGIQGHVAYPDRAQNPIHRVIPALNEICNIKWDNGNEYYDPTSFQISNFNSGTGADNVIPGNVEIKFNFRYSTETSESHIKSKIEEILKEHELAFELSWLPSSKPFLTPSGKLISVVSNSVEQITGLEPQLSTSGGTSDGRFVAPTGAEVVELGPVNATIHKVNECVKVEDLEILCNVYYRIMELLLAKDIKQ